MNKENLPYVVYEKEINLVDLIWNIIYSWRAIIIWSIVLACLLTGIKYGKDIRRSSVKNEIDVEKLRAGLTENELLELERAIKEEASIERQLISNTEYQENSILMNIDPYNENQIVLRYYVNTHYIVNFNEDIPQDYIQGLLKSYLTYVTNGQIVEKCAQKLNIKDNSYLTELINTDLDTVSTADTSFYIAVVGEDMEQARIIAAVIREALEEYQIELSAKIGTHDLVLVADFEQVIQDNALAEKQAKVETTIYNLKLQRDSLKSKLSSQQLQILEEEQNNKRDALEVSETEETSETVGISKKYALLGFLAGIFLVCAVIGIKYILDTHIKNESEFQEVYGLRIFGSMDNFESSKRIFSFVDDWLNRLRGKQKGNLKEQMELTFTNLFVTCKKSNLEKVFFTTSIHLNEEEMKLADHIIKQMEEKGIEVVFEEDMMRNTNALLHMSEIGQVVLVEKEKHTQYNKLEKELTLCQEQKAEVMGVIVVR